MASGSQLEGDRGSLGGLSSGSGGEGTGSQRLTASSTSFTRTLPSTCSYLVSPIVFASTILVSFTFPLYAKQKVFDSMWAANKSVRLGGSVLNRKIGLFLSLFVV